MYMYSYTFLKMSLFCFKKVILNNLFSLFFFFLLEWRWIGIERWPCIGTELQFGHLQFGGGEVECDTPKEWNSCFDVKYDTILRNLWSQSVPFVESFSITKFDKKGKSLNATIQSLVRLVEQFCITRRQWEKV